VAFFYNGKVINNDFLDTVPFRHFVCLIFYRILESRDSIFFFGIPRIQELPGNAADTTAGRNPRILPVESHGILESNPWNLPEPKPQAPKKQQQKQQQHSSRQQQQAAFHTTTKNPIYPSG
jgi:hypothetical protein